MTETFGNGFRDLMSTLGKIESARISEHITPIIEASAESAATRVAKETWDLAMEATEDMSYRLQDSCEFIAREAAKKVLAEAPMLNANQLRNATIVGALGGLAAGIGIAALWNHYKEVRTKLAQLEGETPKETAHA